MRVLFISNLFPDVSEPYRGLDNALVLRHLASRCDIRVISPRPTLPFPWAKRGRTARPEDFPFKPVYPAAAYLPKIGSRVNHLLFAKALEKIVPALREEFPFDVILASWAYPDICAVERLASRLGVPFVAIVQGTDVHSYLEMPVRKRLIVAALNQSVAVITRSRDLGRRLESAGVEPERLHTIYNGVDGDVFKPGDRAEARRELGLPPDAEVALFVGNFYSIKDPLLTVAAHAEWAKGSGAGRKRLLVMVGGGPLECASKQAARAFGTEDLLVFAGRQGSLRVARFMQAADCLLLTSHNEGLPNVVLEAISCGIPIVATNVGGISEMVCCRERGRLVDSRDPRAIAAAIAQSIAPGRAGLNKKPTPFSWPAAAEKYISLLQAALCA